MFIHYLKIAFRNIRKYKVQTAISVCAMAVSLTLLVIVTSLLSKFHGMPLFDMPYADNVAVCNFYQLSQQLSPEELDLLMNHNYRHVDKIIAAKGYDSFTTLASVKDDSGKESQIISRVNQLDPSFLGWMGYRSAITGGVIADLREGEVVLSEAEARKLFGTSNPIGQSLTLKFTKHGENHEPLTIYKELRIADVLKTPELNDFCLSVRDKMFVRKGEISDQDYCLTFYFQLDDIRNMSSLEGQIKEIFPNYDFFIMTAEKDLGEGLKFTIYICQGIFAFLVLFLMVSVWSYLRQQTQLFRIRQCEQALRTTLGAKPRQAFMLYATEVVIVLMLTVVLSLCLSYIIRHVILDRYIYLTDMLNWNIDHVLLYTMISFSVLVLLSAIVCAVTVWRIRRDQTGLALQMRPRPKHRLRNIGITVQLTISILFTTMIFVFLMSTKSIDEYFGTPENDDCYRRGLFLTLNDVGYDKIEPLYQALKKSENVDKVWFENGMMTSYNVSDEDYIIISMYYQSSDEVMDFYDIKIQEPRQVTNQGKSVSVSYAMKDALEKCGVWDDTYLDLFGTKYEINGFFDRIPYLKADQANAVIITDEFGGYNYGNLMILPKEGKKSEVKAEINSLLGEIIPERIDIAPTNLYVMLSPDQNALDVLKFVVFVLAVISMVTTVATIYSSVSLETLRRRKEMALRKINGATTRDICRIFAKTYVFVLAFSIMFSLLIYYVTYDIFNGQDIISYSFTAYLLAAAFVIIVTFLTIARKIHDVMHVDPIEYLKE